MLHYSDELESLDISSVFDIFDCYNVRHDCYSENYLSLLENTTNEIINSRNIKETDLQDKVILALYIRVFSDKFMWKKYKEIYEEEFNTSDVKNQSRELFKKINEHINIEEKNRFSGSIFNKYSFLACVSFPKFLYAYLNEEALILLI